MHRLASYGPINAAKRRRGFQSVSVHITQAATGRKPEVEARPVSASIVFEDSTIRHVLLMGDDSDHFNKIRDFLDYDLVNVISISDQDGPAAIGWIRDQSSDPESKPNKLASTLADRLILGPMIVTGLGHGDQDSMTSIHQGLRLALDHMAHAMAVERTKGTER
jgi:hypothetical protein